jgi:hypothetical protein
MFSSLDTISEEQTIQGKVLGSSDTVDDLPTVYPKVRSFTDTIPRQNDANKALREKIAQ